MTGGALACPVCRGILEESGGAMRCPAGHSYDIASGGSGYVNLLRQNLRRSSDPGDGKEMVAARTLFLDSGAYEPLRREVCRLAADAVAKFAAAAPDKEPIALDVCCGEGYYTRALAESCGASGGKLVGFDLSRPAVKKAAKRCAGLDNVALAVATGTEMPVADASVAAAVEVFAPVFASETARVVAPGGEFIFVSPGAGHLFELKRAIYDEPRPNEEKLPELPGFKLAARDRLSFRFRMESRELVRALFAMTPYYWKSPVEAAARLDATDSLDCTAEFLIERYVRDAEALS